MLHNVVNVARRQVRFNVIPDIRLLWTKSFAHNVNIERFHVTYNGLASLADIFLFSWHDNSLSLSEVKQISMEDFGGW